MDIHNIPPSTVRWQNRVFTRCTSSGLDMEAMDWITLNVGWHLRYKKWHVGRVLSRRDDVGLFFVVEVMFNDDELLVRFVYDPPAAYYEENKIPRQMRVDLLPNGMHYVCLFVKRAE